MAELRGGATLWVLAFSLAAGAARAEPEGSASTASTAVDRAPVALLDEELPPVELRRPHFSEDGRGGTDHWAFQFHGYARMPLRFNGGFSTTRPPYLVDDNYYLSGFGYTRVSESEYAELFFSFEKDRTRIVAGLMASQFSDWSETTLQGQQGIATAFVEHTFPVIPEVELGVRAGMFWDRYGYTPAYDTYLLGRFHVAGARLSVRLFDLWYTRFGFGAHADLINANQGFTPAAWFNTGVDLGWLDAGLFVGSVWTKDSQREFSIIEDGSCFVIGGEARVAIPHVGPFWVALGRYSVDAALFTAPAWEVLHSTGGRGLTQNFLGPDSDNGTGEILATAFTLTWQPHRAIAALGAPEESRYLRGLDLNLFGILARVASNQASDNPAENFNDRTWVKWGIEPYYQPPFEGFSWLFAAVRFDRVILDLDHDSLSFRVITPRIGVMPVTDPKLEIFLAYSAYSYGENVRLRPNQIPGDLSITQPDDNMLKLQAQVAW